MNLSIKLTQKYEFSRINIDMRKPEISQYRNPQYMPKGENKLKMKMMKWINTIDLNTKSCNMPSSNVALSSCRSQLYKVRLQRDCSATVDSNVVLNSSWLVPSRLRKTHVSGTESVYEDRLVFRYSLAQIWPPLFTISHYDIFPPHVLPSHPSRRARIRFSVDTLEYSDKSDLGLILSCSDDIFIVALLNSR